MEESLATIGKRNKADKVSGRHPKTKHYLEEIYPRYMEVLRPLPLSILEIGVKHGGSLRTWRDAFPNAKIYGIEVQEKLWFAEPRIEVFIGDQKDTDFLATVVEETGPLDIIIDDGGHLSSLIVPSFQFLWPHLNSKGLYFIEDVWYTTLNDGYHSEPKIVWDLIQDLSKACCRQSRKASRIWGISHTELDFVHCWRHVAVVGKR